MATAIPEEECRSLTKKAAKFPSLRWDWNRDPNVGSGPSGKGAH